MKVLIKADNQYFQTELEDIAKYLLKPREERKEENSFYFAIKFVQSCCDATKGNIEDIDDPLIFQGIEQARKIILDKSRSLAELQKKLENEVEELDYKIYQIKDKEHDNYIKANNLSGQLVKLGLFHGAEKKALKEQIEALRKPLEVPEEYSRKIEMHKAAIESYKEKLEEYDDLVRGCNWVEQELLLNGKNCKPSEKPQKAHKSRKEEKTINTKSSKKTSFKDQLKPLKSII